MTYNVFSGTLNPTHFTSLARKKTRAAKPQRFSSRTHLRKKARFMWVMTTVAEVTMMLSQRELASFCCRWFEL